MGRWSVRRLGLLVGALVALLVVPGNVLATHHGEGIPDEVAIVISFQGSTLPGAPGQLVVRLQLDNGAPLTGVDVDFWREVDFLGTRRVLLGRTATGPDGTASLAVAPSEVPLHLVASFAGTDGYLAVEGATDISAVVGGVPGGGAAGNTDRAGLSVASELVPLVLALVALAIWLLLLGLTLVTVRAIRGARPTAGRGKAST